MSSWRLVVRELHQAGGQLRTFDFLTTNASKGLEFAKRYGLVKSPGRGGRASEDFHDRWNWELTPKGLDYAEGRIVKIDRVRRVRPESYRTGFIVRFEATWLKSLPRANEIRLSGESPTAVGNAVRLCAACANLLPTR